jgi:RNA-directed DNA polymerase
MKLEPNHIKFIKDSFRELQTKTDLLELLNYCKALIYGDKGYPISLSQLNYNAYSDLNKNRYIEFTIKKKSGSDRTIHAPNNGLKVIQTCLNLILQIVYEKDISKAATGFIPGKSIVDNAKVHIGSNYVFNIDLKDFFPSIDQARIWARLKHPPFNLNEAGDRLQLANLIASICCHEMEVERLDSDGNWEKVKRNVLPQGAPTSPILTNIVCQQLDYFLSAVANRFGVRYTRYEDDITFSSMHNVYQKNGEFRKEVQRIISLQNFHIKATKTRLQKRGERQEVTGLTVNELTNVSKRYIKQIRLWLHYWESFGYERANAYFSEQYLYDKGHVKNGLPNLMNVLLGKLDYLKMVKGNTNNLYVKLKERYNSLLIQSKGLEKKYPSHEEILNVLFAKGLKEAMEIYQPLK